MVQYNPHNGKVLQSVTIPASDVIELEFGGPYFRTLFVGTSNHFLENNGTQPDAGAIFAISGTGAHGFMDNDIQNFA